MRCDLCRDYFDNSQTHFKVKYIDRVQYKLCHTCNKTMEGKDGTEESHLVREIQTKAREGHSGGL